MFDYLAALLSTEHALFLGLWGIQLSLPPPLGSVTRGMRRDHGMLLRFYLSSKRISVLQGAYYYGDYRWAHAPICLSEILFGIWLFGKLEAYSLEEGAIESHVEVITTGLVRLLEILQLILSNLTLVMKFELSS
jgi:hypothetical protein